MTEQRIRLTKLIAEGVAIVASILLAFFIDASWDAREDRNREDQFLIDLQADFLENQLRLGESIEFHRRRMAALEILAEIANSEGIGVPSDSVELAVSFLVAFGSFDARMTALDALDAAGDRGVVGDAVLRDQLATWERDLRDANETQALLTAAVTRDVYGWLRSGVPAPDVGLGLDDFPAVFSRGEPRDWGPFLRTDEFRNLVLQQAVLEFLGTRELEGLAKGAEEILRRIPESLSQ